jgi:hypothetical protein
MFTGRGLSLSHTHLEKKVTEQDEHEDNNCRSDEKPQYEKRDLGDWCAHTEERTTHVALNSPLSARAVKRDRAKPAEEKHKPTERTSQCDADLVVVASSASGTYDGRLQLRRCNVALDLGKARSTLLASRPHRIVFSTAV